MHAKFKIDFQRSKIFKALRLHVAILIFMLIGWRGAVAEDLPTLPVRTMAIESDAIVIAVPVNSKPGVPPTDYKLLEVLHGSDLKAGQTIQLHDIGCELSLPKWYSKETQPAPVIAKVLLFLTVSRNGDHSLFQPVLSGFRAVTLTGDVLAPQQLMNPGPQYLLNDKDAKWDQMLARVRSDVPQIAEIRAFGAIENSIDRNQVILKWLGEHKSELDLGSREANSWGNLVSQLFDWVMESCIVDDCWRAIEIHAGSEWFNAHTAFSSFAGRKFLLDKVFDGNVPDKLRLQALKQLGRSFWDTKNGKNPNSSDLTKTEQELIISRISPLAHHADANWRYAATQCIFSASHSFDGNRRDMDNKSAVPLFVAIYKNDRDKDVRQLAAEAIRRLEDESFWEKVSGNPLGIVVFESLQLGHDVLDIGLCLQDTKATITEKPTMLLERIDDDGKPLDTKRLSPDLLYPKDVFQRGWKSFQNQITLTLPLADLASGRWRVTAEGPIGNMHEHWRSIPAEITIP